jgi:hypothetical protein
MTKGLLRVNDAKQEKKKKVRMQWWQIDVRTERIVMYGRGSGGDGGKR